MCRVMLVLVTLLAMPLGALLNGQTTRPTESELVGRIDSLSVILRRADRVANVADAARDEERRRLLTGQIDTVQVGPFFVVTPVAEVNLGRRYFEGAWAHYVPIVGAERTSLEGHVFIFGKREAPLGLNPRVGTRVTMRFMPRLDRDRAFARLLGAVIAADLPDDLRTWVVDFYIRPEQTRELEGAYESLVTTASVAVTDCYDGTADRCWDAMGLDHRDDWVTAWYTAPERRALVRPASERRALVRHITPSSSPRADGVLASCLDDENDDACAAVLVDRGAAASIPLPPRARMTLVAHALMLGGPEGFSRLIADTEGPIKDRLTRASGVTADSLIGSWRAATLQARPDAHADTKKMRWSSLIWLLALAGVSTRSTRWRLT